jgi:hypothetical protein
VSLLEKVLVVWELAEDLWLRNRDSSEYHKKGVSRQLEAVTRGLVKIQLTEKTKSLLQ